MRLSHPAAPFQGIDPRDVFLVSTDSFVQMGYGYVVRSYQTSLYPDRPLQIYLHMDAQPSARTLLLGALLARAEQLRQEFPTVKARIYAFLPTNHWDMINFYMQHGFVSSDAEEEYLFDAPTASIPPVPMGCQLYTVPLTSQEEALSFLRRLNEHRLMPITPEYFYAQMQQPYFCAIGYYHNQQTPVAELFTTGSSDGAAGLVSLYVDPRWRRKKMATQLLTAAGTLLAQRGAKQFITQGFARNVPQAALLQSVSATRKRIVSLLPSIEIG